MPALTNLSVLISRGRFNIPDIIPLFPQGIKCPLEDLTIVAYHMPQVEYIDFRRIVALMLGTSFNVIDGE